MPLTYNNTLGSNSLMNALTNKINPSFGPLKTGIQTSTPYAATRAMPTPIQKAYGEQGSVTGYSGAPQISPRQQTPQASTQPTPPLYKSSNYGGSSSDPSMSAAPTPYTKEPMNDGFNSGTNFNKNYTLTDSNYNPIGPIPTLGGTVNTLTTAGQNAQNIAEKFGKEIADVGQAGAQGAIGAMTTGTTPVASGNAALIGQTTAAKQQALAQGEQAALQGTGQNISALGTAAGLVQPSPTGYGQTVFNPATGTFGAGQAGGQAGGMSGSTNGGSAVSPNDPFFNTIANYAKLRATGQENLIPGSITGNSVLNDQVTQMAKMINPDYNSVTTPTISGQNASQGAKFQGQAADLSSALKALDTLTPTITNFLSSSGLNQQTSPLFNKSINSFLAQATDPGIQAQAAMMRSELEKYAFQILSTSGMTPTDTQSFLNSYDPANLPSSQLPAYLETLRNMGQINLDSLQSGATGSYSANTPGGTTPYIGPQATPSAQTPTTPVPPTYIGKAAAGHPFVQGLIGGAGNLLGGIEGAAQHVFGLIGI